MIPCLLFDPVVVVGHHGPRSLIRGFPGGSSMHSVHLRDSMIVTCMGLIIQLVPLFFVWAGVSLSGH